VQRLKTLSFVVSRRLRLAIMTAALLFVFKGLAGMAAGPERAQRTVLATTPIVSNETTASRKNQRSARPDLAQERTETLESAPHFGPTAGRP